MKFVKIAHYVEKSFDDNPSFIIEMRDGVEYISNGCVFVVRTDENITQLIEEYDCEPELNELLVADAIEMCDVVDASHMFSFSKITEFSSDISSVDSARYMFWSTPLTKFSGDMSSVVDASYMFYYSRITDFLSTVSTATITDDMFAGSPLVRDLRNFFNIS